MTFVKYNPPRKSLCPHCRREIVSGWAAGPVNVGRCSICCQCGGFVIVSDTGGFRAPTSNERVRLEASGLAASLREDLERFQVMRQTGKLPPKQLRPVDPEPIFNNER